jgi:general secretion pathway protein A
MEYFRILNLKKEPFSNSPEPDFFYSSVQHRSCLQQLELAIRLHRGLNVVIGDVGTGKTTICRQLILKFAHHGEEEDGIQPHLLMDPSFSTPMEFLNLVANSFGLALDKTEASEWRIKEKIKHYLFENCVDGRQIVVLIIDEGQKLPDFCLEILREFLNYETNEHKLLQIVIFAQKEFQDIIRKYPNFKDRVNQFYFLEPLSFQETKNMIKHRIAKASDYEQMPELFTLSGLWGVYHYTGGYPRRIITLCHQVMLALIIQNWTKANYFLIRSCAKRVSTEKFLLLAYRKTFLVFVGLISIIFGIWIYNFENADSSLQSSVANKAQPAMYSPKVAAVERMPSGKAENTSGEYASPLGEKPVTLGVMKIEEGDTVYLILHKVYGNYDEKLVIDFQKMNPHITNINMVSQGDSVKIPALPARRPPLNNNGCWIRIAAKSTLNDALDCIRFYPPDLPTVRLFPYWNKKEGLIFAVLISNRFNNHKEALSVINGTASPYLKKAKVVCQWEQGTEFYIR